MTVSLVGSERDAARQYAVSHAADYLYYELQAATLPFCALVGLTCQMSRVSALTVVSIA